MLLVTDYAVVDAFPDEEPILGDEQVRIMVAGLLEEGEQYSLCAVKDTLVCDAPGLLLTAHNHDIPELGMEYMLVNMQDDVFNFVQATGLEIYDVVSCVRLNLRTVAIPEAEEAIEAAYIA